MQVIFSSQFVNTGVLVLLMNANFDNTFLSFVPVRNRFSDFTSAWYLTIGNSIVETMIIATIMPYVSFGMAYSQKLLPRLFDSSCTCFRKVPKTRKITVQQYVNLYSGKNDVELHKKYSICMNFVFVAFLHGLALPILFPIAAFGIFNMYVTERLQFAYFYKKPPLMDNKLNESSLSILQFAPIGMLLLGYWQLGNRQQFFNESSDL